MKPTALSSAPQPLGGRRTLTYPEDSAAALGGTVSPNTSTALLACEWREDGKGGDHQSASVILCSDGHVLNGGAG